MRTRLLIDEIATRQDVQCQQLNADNLVDEDEDVESIAWGADPFNIIAHREEHGLTNHD